MSKEKETLLQESMEPQQREGQTETEHSGAQGETPCDRVCGEENALPENHRPVHRWKKPVWIGVLTVAAALVLCYAGLCVAAGMSKTVASGVYVLDVDMGGLSREQAAQRWEQEQAALLERTTVSLTAGEETLSQVTLQQMGASAAAEAAVDAAWNVTHDNIFLGGWYLLYGWLADIHVQPQWTVDSGTMRRCAKELSEQTCIPAKDGAWRLDESKSDGFYVTCAADGYRIDPAQLMTSLRTALEQGDLSPVSCSYQSLAGKPLDLDALHQEICAEGISAMYDKATGGLTEERLGVEFDLTEAKALLEQAEPGVELEIPATITRPKVTKEELEEVLFRDELGSYTTYVSGSWGRIRNVEIAADSINYWVLNPGESFSYNEGIGPTTAANGYHPAPSYVGGKTVDDYGGGVCQVSSTLYYATLLANLEIVTRYCHQYAPSYIPFGCDATVYEYPIDFVFRNNTDYPIRIVTSWYGYNLTVTIQGTKVDDSYVEMVTSIEGEYPYEVIYREVDNLAPGVEVVEQDPYTGYTVYAWRYVYAGDGTLISSNLESVSNYESRDMIIKVGKKLPPKPAPEPAPAPKPAPAGGA